MPAPLTFPNHIYHDMYLRRYAPCKTLIVQRLRATDLPHKSCALHTCFRRLAHRVPTEWIPPHTGRVKRGRERSHAVFPLVFLRRRGWV